MKSHLQIQEESGEDQLVMLRHVKTRWLQLQSCVKRILLQWDVIVKLFGEVKKPTDRVIRIRKLLTTETKTQLFFLQYLLELLMPFERKFQNISILIAF